MQQVGEDTHRLLGQNLVGLTIGGSFGRGEGAIDRRDGQERPFNDVDLFLFVNEPGSIERERLLEIERRHTATLGAHVEFSRPISVRSVPKLQPALMWFDLCHGYCHVVGEDVVKLMPASLRSQVPAFEGARLLLNRGAGLLWAMRIARGCEQTNDRDFVCRNVYKARLAFLDASLIQAGCYQTPLSDKVAAYERWFALNKPKAELLSLVSIDEAVRFRHDPSAFTTEYKLQSTESWVEAFLELESIRFGRPFISTIDYGRFSAAREPAGTSTETVKNILRNLKNRRIGVHHPRQALYLTLPRLLAMNDGGWESASARFLDDWRRLC